MGGGGGNFFRDTPRLLGKPPPLSQGHRAPTDASSSSSSSSAVGRRRVGARDRRRPMDRSRAPVFTPLKRAARVRACNGHLLVAREISSLDLPRQRRRNVRRRHDHHTTTTRQRNNHDITMTFSLLVGGRVSAAARRCPILHEFSRVYAYRCASESAIQGEGRAGGRGRAGARTFRLERQASVISAR